jgi:hypothetical protein
MSIVHVLEEVGDRDGGCVIEELYFDSTDGRGE